MAESTRARGTAPQRAALPLALLAFGVVAWQKVFHSLFVVRSEGGFDEHLPHVVRDGFLAIAPAYLAIRLGDRWLKGRPTRTNDGALVRQAAVTSLLYLVSMLAAVPAHTKIDAVLSGAEVDEGPVFAHAVRDGLIGQMGAFPLLVLSLVVLRRRPGLSDHHVVIGGPVVVLGIAVAFDLGLSAPTIAAAVVVGVVALLRPEVPRDVALRAGLAVCVLAALTVVSPPLGSTQPAGAQGALDSDGCSTTSPVRAYDVAAINIDMVLNQYGDHDPTAMMYVLEDRIADVRAQEASRQVTAGLRNDAIQPLVLRANVGDCLELNFTNRLDTGLPASLNIYGMPYSASNGGGEVGTNPNSFATPGQTITYRLPVPDDPAAEGSYGFHSRYEARQTMAHGLFGQLVVEPRGSIYLDPEDTSREIESGWQAIIVDPTGVDFREFVIMMHEVGDEDFEVLDVNDDPIPLIDDETGAYRPASRALNYRSEPFRNRLQLGGDKSLGYSSYSYGDPATPVPRSYLGEPTKTRISHPGSEVFHVYHLHGGGTRWRRNPGTESSDFATGLQKVPTQNTMSTRLDSQSVGPGEAYDLEHECGAGGCQQAAGDFLYHCHIGNHYIAGMWAFWRVFDTQQPDLAGMPPDPVFDAPPVAQSGSSLDLIGTVVDGRTLVPTSEVDQPNETSLEDFLAAQLPPQGQTLDDDDATVWDWTIEYVDDDLTKPLLLGEPATTASWPGFSAVDPGERNPIQFNLVNARPAWPMFEPQLAKRPPFTPNGHGGSPWLGDDSSLSRPDGLCPSTDQVPGRRQLDYPITAIDTPVPISPSFTDPNGMLFVLNEQKEALRAGEAPAEPLVIRSNVGDCVSVILTSEQEEQNHEGFAKANIHTHFVQFDPQGSDGVVSGFSYEQGVRPYETEQRTLVGAVTPGDQTIEVTNVDRLRVGISIGIGLGEGMCNATGGPVELPTNADRPCTEIRSITAIDGTTLSLDRPLQNTHATGDSVGVEFVQYQWYSDVDTGTVFFHDHVNFSNWDHGLFGALIVEPKGSVYRNPTTGNEIRSGSTADIVVPPGSSVGADQQGSFREQVVFLQNARVDDGQGGERRIATLNMRSAPYGERDSEFPFSSVTNGDPTTPILRAYVGDSVVFRGLGVTERIGALRVAGHRFRQERFADQATLYDTINLGISEREDLVLEVGAGGPAGTPGDYLYYSTKQEDLEDGAWGILRVHDTNQEDLQVLPGYPIPSPGAGFPHQGVTGDPPETSNIPGNPCPASATERVYNVVLSELPTERQFFALATDEAQILAGTKPLEPLVLRVNSGDCLEVTVRNRSGDRGSFSVSKLIAGGLGSLGSAVGFNPDSTIDRGEVRTHRYFADQELGTSLFFSLADPRSSMRGAYGAIIVEPAGSTWRDPEDGTQAASGLVADIVTPTGAFREQVILFEDDDDKIGANTMPYPVAVENMPTINYQAAPFTTAQLDGRLDIVPDPALVYDTDTHGDPTTVLRAYTGDAVRLRVGVGSGQQAHVLGLGGHRFPWEVGIDGSEQLAAKGILPSESFDMHLVEGAGAGITTAADYLIENRRMPFHEGGMWGLLRTFDTQQSDLLPLEEPGMLRVTTTPAVPSQVVIDGVPRDTWSTEWVDLRPGSYEICFTDVAGFTTPPCESTTIVAGDTTVVNGQFTPRGYLRVDTSPAVPSTISLDGLPRNDWGVWTDLEPGDYQLCFGEVAGFDPPPCELVTVTAGLTTHITGTFSPSESPGASGFGFLRARTDPSIPSQISIDGTPMDTWALTWVKLPPGSYEVCFSDVEGFTTPACQTAELTEDATTVVDGFFAQRGSLRVDTSPPTPATILLDGIPRDAWGMWTDLEPGAYEVCFSAPAGPAPPCEVVDVEPGTTTSVTAPFP